MVIYFREEIYTFTTDLHKYPILTVAESLQVRKYLGSGWTFGSGQDAIPDIDPSKIPEMDAAAGAAAAAADLVGNVTSSVASVITGNATSNANPVS
ncbi:hypothetical protein GPECTOR_14g171 [Gonium pectorale]|uniref:Uncharacterized protein n=1 Tax=Gonium pectorale TaxID=33097 RepID=A0A150GME1_GONPE|nr:hypothetical protein GPECTOR_14g171 [Gonium pectorale]|eukprot:KXZ50925.1 hypothetical protein GPECTOR_14g171 [Gonium pectorale]